MKVAILFDGISALGASPDLAILTTVEAVEQSLGEEEHASTRIPVNPDGRWIERLRRGKFDVVFNLCEGVDGAAALEPAVIGVLELLGIPYTGASSWTTSLCLRKHLVNGLFESAGLPVPPFAVVRPGDKLPSIGFPAICKPAAEDASLGVEQRSVVRTMRALGERMSAMHERWNEILVQRYVDGREVNVGILNGHVLPIAEIRFDRMPAGMWKIVSYRSKWMSGSDEDIGSVPQCPAELPTRIQRELSTIALEAWKLVGGSGYGRCDFRIDRAGRPWLLEVNANPDIAPDAGLARMARVAGLDYAALVRLVVQAALDRPSLATSDRWTLTQALSGIEEGEAPLDRVAEPVSAEFRVGPLGPQHRERVEQVVRSTGAFNDEEVEVALEVFDDAVTTTAAEEFDAEDPYQLLGVFDGERLAGYAAFGHTPGTEGTFDLYWIAVDPELQGAGAGSALVAGIEAWLKKAGARLLVAETSSRGDYEKTRAFYERRGFRAEARVAEFYAPADDRLLYLRRLDG